MVNDMRIVSFLATSQLQAHTAKERDDTTGAYCPLVAVYSQSIDSELYRCLLLYSICYTNGFSTVFLYFHHTQKMTLSFYDDVQMNSCIFFLAKVEQNK